uniref:Transthyretin-like family protein n=1 Tax=Steinernema glaseri TaxID=37863 RepID=A0A1I7Z457_9BILA
MNYLLALSLAALLATQGEAFRRQSVAVRGKLMCGGKPASDILVKLVDDDRGPDPDDLLDSVYTKTNGEFFLSGGTMELTNIDPEIRIYHDCNDHGRPCKREWVIGIPDKYITSGSEPKKVMNMGELNLEVELESEDHDCLNN